MQTMKDVLKQSQSRLEDQRAELVGANGIAAAASAQAYFPATTRTPALSAAPAQDSFGNRHPCVRCEFDCNSYILRLQTC